MGRLRAMVVVLHVLCAFALLVPAATQARAALLPHTAAGWVDLSPLLPAGPVPTTASGAVAFDPTLGVSVYFEAVTGKTWTLDPLGGGWQLITTTGPGPRGLTRMAYDPANDNIVLFGGDLLTTNPFTPLDDTWTFDGQTWTQHITATTPPARDRGALAWSEPLGAMVMFGGTHNILVPPSGVALNDTWKWDGDDWTQLQPPSAPPPLIDFDLVEDPVHDQIVLFGGADAQGLRNETWLFDGSNWREVVPSSSPPATMAHTMVFDPNVGVVLYGGVAPVGSTLIDSDSTYAWDGTTWTELPTVSAPPPQHYVLSVYDAVAGVSLMIDVRTAPSAAVWALIFVPPDVVAVRPERLLETRIGEGQLGYVGAKPVAGQTVQVQVTGTGAASVPADASAVVLNVTVTNTDGNGFVTVWPCGQPRPMTSNLNYGAGSTVANLVIAGIGTAGKVCLFTSNGADLVADIDGWMPFDSWYTPEVPERLLETRTDEGQVAFAGPKPKAGQTVELQVVGAGKVAVPADASAVVLNVTVTNTDESGFVTVWPCGQPRPLASNLNYTAGSTVANLVIAGIGTAGKVCLFTSNGADLIADINGWMPFDALYSAVTPERLLETRPSEGQVGYAGPRPVGGRTVQLRVSGVGATAVPADATAVVLNLTVTNTDGNGFVTVWPCGQPRPLASNLNFTIGSTVANLAVSELGTDGSVCLFVSSGADLIADINGYFL